VSRVGVVVCVVKPARPALFVYWLCLYSLRGVVYTHTYTHILVVVLGTPVRAGAGVERESDRASETEDRRCQSLNDVVLMVVE
jgi:hypothetical protein